MYTHSSRATKFLNSETILKNRTNQNRSFINSSNYEQIIGKTNKTDEGIARFFKNHEIEIESDLLLTTKVGALPFNLATSFYKGYNSKENFENCLEHNYHLNYYRRTKISLIECSCSNWF